MEKSSKRGKMYRSVSYCSNNILSNSRIQMKINKKPINLLQKWFCNICKMHKHILNSYWIYFCLVHIHINYSKVFFLQFCIYWLRVHGNLADTFKTVLNSFYAFCFHAIFIRFILSLLKNVIFLLPFKQWSNSIEHELVLLSFFLLKAHNWNAHIYHVTYMCNSIALFLSSYRYHIFAMYISTIS